MVKCKSENPDESVEIHARNANLTAVKKGSLGEDRACAYLDSRGIRILERNFRIRGGEIDIIGMDGKFLVFFEVKSLPNGNPDMLAAVLNPKKQQRIIKTAKRWLQKYRQYYYGYIRFDVLAIDVPGLEPVCHIENAFSE